MAWNHACDEYRGDDGRWYLTAREALATGGIVDEHHCDPLDDDYAEFHGGDR